MAARHPVLIGHRQVAWRLVSDSGDALDAHENRHRKAVVDRSVRLPGMQVERIVVHRLREQVADAVGVTRFGERARQKVLQLVLDAVPVDARGSGSPAREKRSRSSPADMLRTCDGSRSSSSRFSASAFSGAGAISATTTRPPGAATRAISRSAASGSSRWWNAKRELTMEKCASGNGSAFTSPWCQVTFCRSCAACALRASSSMAGVRSSPTACRTTRANAQASKPGPQATSSEVSWGPRFRQSNDEVQRLAAFRIALASANGTACRVNWSRIRCWWVSIYCMLDLPKPFAMPA